MVLAAEPLLRLAETVHAASGPWRDLDPYYFYGRLFFLVYLGAIAGIVALNRLQPSGPRRDRLWFRVVLVGLVVALGGDVAAYWGGSGDISQSSRARAGIRR